MKLPFWLFIATLSACGVKAGNPKTPDGKVWIEGRFPAAATSNTAVTFRGRNFGRQRGAVKLSDGREATLVSWTNEEVIANLPAVEEGTCSQARLESADQDPSNVVPISYGDHNLWIPMNEVPTPRSDFASVWTGDEMFIWGGGSNSGWRYNPRNASWLPISMVNAPEFNMPLQYPEPAPNVFAFSRDKEVILWGNSGEDFSNFTTSFRVIASRYSLTENAWSTMPMEHAPRALPGNTAVLAEDRLIIWGGHYPCGGDMCVPAEQNGGIFELDNNAWRSMSAFRVDETSVPVEKGDEPRFFHTAVWTGTEMIVWGGFTESGSSALNASEAVQSGAAYDPRTDTWRPISKTGAPSPRGYHVAVWTGTEMIIWGGAADYFASGGLSDGAAYDPKTDQWRPIAAGPKSGIGTRAAWSGDLLLVYGGSRGFESGQSPIRLASTYEPRTDKWTDMTQSNSLVESRVGLGLVWTGNEFLIWGGKLIENIKWSIGLAASVRPYRNVLSFRPDTGVWSSQEVVGEPGMRDEYSTLWTGKELLIWGGRDLNSPNAYFMLHDGARYDPVTNTWLPMSVEGAPDARAGHRAVWTGSEMLVIGGWNWGDPPGPGARYNPATDSWRELPASPGDLDRRAGHAAAWDGTEAIVWGGFSVTSFTTIPITSTTLAFRPSTNLWEVLPSSGSPQPSRASGAVWTSAGMFLWAGGQELGAHNPFVVGLYSPESREWSAVTLPTMSPIAPVSGVWSGEELLLFGADYPKRYTPLGRAYNPTSGLWRELDLTGAHSASVVGAVWTGSEALVYGGSEIIPNLSSKPFGGYRYNPSTDLWKRMNTGCVSEMSPYGGEGIQTDSIVWIGDRALIYGPHGVSAYIP